MTDLPYGRGGSPLQNLIVRGHKETKISAIKVVKELDAGPVLSSLELMLNPQTTSGELEKKLSEMEQSNKYSININDISIRQIYHDLKYDKLY